MVQYRTSNGYGNIDTNAIEWQLGRKLFDTQVLLSQLKYSYKPITESMTLEQQNKALEICTWFCGLVAHVGELKEDYSTLKRCLMDPGRFKFINDGPRKLLTTEQMMGLEDKE